MARSWNQALLASGLPLENDVRKFLQSKGCITQFEYSYLKPDDTRIEKQFSYDIDASYIKKHHFVDFMIECKYRRPGVRWVFLPEHYEGPNEIYPNDFLHDIDDFISPNFQFKGRFPRTIALACSKGIEIIEPKHTNIPTEQQRPIRQSSHDNDQAIVRATSQLAYAMARKISNSIEHQVYKYLVEDHIFYHIPIIATTAELYRIKPDTTLADITDAKDLDGIAEPCDVILLAHDVGIDLRNYNRHVYTELRKRLDMHSLKNAFKSQITENVDFFFSILADHYPRAFLVVHVTPDWQGFNRVFSYIDDLFSPPSELLEEIITEQKRMMSLASFFADSHPKMKIDPTVLDP